MFLFVDKDILFHDNIYFITFIHFQSENEYPTRYNHLLTTHGHQTFLKTGTDLVAGLFTSLRDIL